jgi:glucose-6-phosphate isomerase
MQITRPVAAHVDRVTGALDTPDHVYERRLSDMADMYEDAAAATAAVESGDPVLYRVYEKKVPETAGELQWCMSVLLPGKVGREYYMTKGHFHAVRETAEIYFCVRGRGYMLMETEDGRTELAEMRPDAAVYVPGGWAHRSINTGEEPLISFCVYPGHAGHDYGSIETRGFLKRVVEMDGRPEVIDNPLSG